MVKYLEDLVPNDTCKIAFHKMSPFQKGTSNKGHRDVGFSSCDPDIVKRDFDIIQSFGRGIDPSRLGVIPNWYGPHHNSEPYIETACGLYLRECEQRGMFISHNCDQGIGGGTSGMLDALAYLNTNYFPSKAYLRDENGKLLISEFTANTVDWNAVAIAYPQLRILHWIDNGPDNYAWLKPETFDHGIDNPLPLNRLIKDNQRAYMNAVGMSFDDAYTKDITLSTWPEVNGVRKPRRWINPRGGKFWLDAWASVRKDVKIVQVVTFDDYDEDSCVAKALGVKTDRPFAMPAGLDAVFPNIVAELAAPPDMTPTPPPLPLPVIPSGKGLIVVAPLMRMEYTEFSVAVSSAVIGTQRMEVWWNNTKLYEIKGSVINQSLIIPPFNIKATGPDANQLIVQAVGTVNGNPNTVLARWAQSA